MQALVTTAIPTYNYGRFIGQAIDSVLGQSYRRIECIVVDDGSADDTRQVLQTFGNRIRVIHQDHRGPAAARNRGASEAHGEYIAFLDADDWWLPEKIELQMRWLEEKPNIGCVGCGRQHVDADGSITKIPGQTNRRTREQTLRDIAVRKFWIGGSDSGVVIRREVFEAVGGFDERLTASEDWDMWLRLSAITGLDNVPEILTSIRRHRSGMMRDARRVEKNSWLIYDKAVQAWPAVLTNVDRRRMRALILTDAAGECVGAGQSLAALRYVARSLGAWPFDGDLWRMAAAAGVVSVRGSRKGGRRF